MTSIRYSSNVILLATVLTAVMVIVLTLYAYNTETDFTMCGGFLLVASVVLVVAVLLNMFLHLKWLHVVISVFTIMLYSVFLIFDTQLIVGGKHERAAQLSIDDYIMGAVLLYTDIIVLFTEVLKAIGSEGN